MTCNYFNTHIELLFDSQTTQRVRRHMLQHSKTCPPCAECYRQTQAALCAVTSNKELHAPAELKERILNAARTLPPTKNSHRRLQRLTLPLSIAATILLVLLLFNPADHYKAHAAGHLFKQAAAQLSTTAAFYIEMEVRTLPAENFAYIDAREPFVQHRMWVVPEIPEKWRLEKQGRIALCNGERILLWHPHTQTGSIHLAGDGVIEDFSLLLHPSALLLREQAAAKSHKKATYRKEITEENILLTIESPARGDFTNDYMRNTSIEESDSRRTYRFDRTTGRLQAAAIDILTDRGWTTVLRLREIRYDSPAPDSLFLAGEGIAWNDLTQPLGGNHFAGITPEQTVQKLFGALQTWNEEVVREAFAYYNLNQIKAQYAGCRLLEIKEPFRSGLYCGVFVPCLIAKPDGKQERLQLALRNDNPSESWVVDGGI